MEVACGTLGHEQGYVMISLVLSKAGGGSRWQQLHYQYDCTTQPVGGELVYTESPTDR